MNDSAVAIVGLACRLPGAADAEHYWANLRAGADTISRFSVDQVIAAGVDPGLARDSAYVPARGVVDGGERFDRAFFGYGPAEAAGIDPQQRVLLETSSTALDDAGIDPWRFDGWIGVFAGCDAAGPPAGAAVEDELTRLIGYEKDFLATRVAYKLGLRGPAITLQTACSTSLVAVHTACQSLLGYECDAALAGGVSLALPQTAGYLYEEGHILSRDGYCRPFDAAASGTVSSGGVGVVVLRRLADALRDGDRIVAVVRGCAVNNDGGEKIGYTAPSVTGQRDVIRFALAQADVEAGDIGYVETHGTGTRVGDPVEVAGLTAAFQESTDRIGYCLLGAAKSNIGHTGAAAGVAGLVKTALMLQRRELVPTVHFHAPNPELQLDTTPFRICARREPWPADGPLLAGVSSFGIGGTNAHAVLESPPSSHSPRGGSGPRLLCLSAATPTALDRLRGDLADHLDGPAAPRLGDAAWTLASGRRRYPHRLTAVADDGARAAVGLRDATPATATAEPEVAFLFPGQGTLCDGAGAAAYALLPEFRRIFDEIRGETADRFDIDLGAVLRPDTDPAWLRDTEHQQLALFALGYALAGQLGAWGVRPVAMLGHSIGEYVAAALAGMWSRSDALTVVRRRGRAMRETAPGRMLAATLTMEAAGGLVDAESELALAVAGPGQVVFSGPVERVEALHARLDERGTPCRPVDTERAFHSPLMRPAAAGLRDAVSAVPEAPARLPFVSNLTGDWVEPGDLCGPDHWADHLCGTVRLAEGVDRLLGRPCDVLVELGPGETMTRAVRRHRRRDGEHSAVALLGGHADGQAAGLLTALGRLWELGVDVDAAEPLADARPTRCALPPHPFEPTVCESAAPRAPTVGPDTNDALTRPSWSETPTASEGRHDALLIVGAPDTPARRLVEALGGRGARLEPTDRPSRCDPETLDHVLDDLGAEGAAPAVVVALPDEIDPPLLDAVDRLVDRASRHEVAVVLIARDVTDVSGRVGAHPELTAWARHRLRAAPAAVRVLDIDSDAEDEYPALPPVVDGRSVVYAWHGRRWWSMRSEPVRVETAPTPPGGPIGVVASDATRGARAAARLAENGLRIGAFASVDAPREAVSPSVLADGARWDAPEPRLSRRPDLRADLDTYCTGLIGRFVLGRAGLGPNERIAEPRLRARLDPGNRLPRLIDLLLRTLTEAGWPRDGDDIGVPPDVEERLAAAMGAGDALDEVAGLRRLLEHCVAAYPEVFEGTREPASVLFADGDETWLREHMLDNRVHVGDADPCVDALCRAVVAFGDRHPDRPLRVLEVGAGGGGLSWRLLDRLRDRAEVTYHFTDISPLRVRQARGRAAEFGSVDMRFSVFDITEDPDGQGLAAGTYDLVLAYNAVHLAPSIRAGLARLRRLLAVDGLLGVVELAETPLWMNLAWGLASGWWGFEDELRDGSVHTDPATWTRALNEVGCTEVAVVPEDLGADHVLLLASSGGADAADPADRVAGELRRQAPAEGFDGLVYLADADDEGAAARWAGLRDRVDPASARVVSADPGDGWRGELRRRELDPTTVGPRPRWSHVEVPAFGDAELAALPVVLNRGDLPPVVRMGRPVRSVEGDTGDRPEGGRGAAGTDTETAAATASRHLGPPERELAALWCDVLGVSTAGWDDDFFELGGESLMAIQLTTRARQRFGRPVPVTVFSEHPTFGRLVELARPADPGRMSESAGPTRDPDLLVLRDTGARTPLFLIAPAAGSSLCYRGLARSLGDDQPCYGIESPGLHDGTKPPARFEDVAEHHIEVIRRVRPHGPYVLGGWSVGAMVAHEVARGLARLGESVEMVVCVDSCVMDTRGRPLAVAPGILGRALWYELRVRLPVSRAGLGGPTGPRGIDGIADVAGGPEFAKVFGANIRAMLRYRPRWSPGRAVVFSTGLSGDAPERLRRRVAPVYRRGAEVHPVSGDHWTVLDSPHVERLAEGIRRALESLDPHESQGNASHQGETR